MDGPDEQHLYRTDREAWCEEVAAGWVRMLTRSDDDELNTSWGYACDKLRNAVWKLAPAELRARIKAIRLAAAQSAADGKNEQDRGGGRT